MLAAASNDTRQLLSIVVLLAVLGLGLLMFAVWLVKATRPDRELLAPLEVMGQSRWRKSDPVWQRRQLDAVRPEGAEPLSPVRATPHLDEAFDAGPQAPGFDDLPPELAEVVAVGFEAEVDRDATPPSQEIPAITRATERPDGSRPETADAASTAAPDDVPLTDLATPDEGPWPAPIGVPGIGEHLAPPAEQVEGPSGEGDAGDTGEAPEAAADSPTDEITDATDDKRGDLDWAESNVPTAAEESPADAEAEEAADADEETGSDEEAGPADEARAGAASSEWSDPGTLFDDGWSSRTSG